MISRALILHICSGVEMFGMTRLWILALGFIVCLQADINNVMAEESGEQSSPVVLSIDVDGNRFVEKETILAKLVTAVGKQLDRRQLGRDVRNLYKAGYFSDIRVEGTRTAEGVHLVIKVKEYPLIAKMNLEGNEEVVSKDLEVILKLKAGRIFSPANQASDLNTIRKQYLKKGFYQVDVRFEATPTADGRVDLVIRISEGEVTRIERIRFIGNQAFGDDELRGEIASRQSDNTAAWLTDRDVYEQQRLETDGQMLQQFYLNRGYLDVNIESSRLTMAADKQSFSLTLSMSEGDQYTVDSIDVQGDMIPDKETLMALIKLKAGEIYSLNDLRSSIEAISDRVGDEGYAFASVTPMLNRDINADTVAVTLDVEKGAEVYVERLEISGNEKTEDDTIRRLTKQAEGARYSGSQVRKTKQEIKRVPYVEDVRVSFPKGTDSKKVKMKVDVTEKKSGSFTFGIGYSQIEKVVLTGSVTEENLFGKGYQASVEGSIGGVTQNYNATLTDPYFLGENLTASLNLFRTQSDQLATQTFDQTSDGGSISFGLPLRDHVSYGISYRYSRTDLKSSPYIGTSLFVLAQVGTQSSGEVIQSLSWDNRDRTMGATEGHREVLQFGVAGAGGATRFWETSLSSEGFFSFGEHKNYILNPSISGKYIRGYSNRDVPLYRRFSLGGIGSMRGFDTLGISMRDPVTNEAIGGDRELRGSLNLFFPIPYMQTAGIRGIVFADAGLVWGSVSTTVGAVSLNVTEPFSMSRVRYSTGIGFEWMSPVGPIGLIWSFPIRTMQGDVERSFEFALGRTF